MVDEPPVPDSVVLIRSVLAAINFDDEAPLPANEVDDVATDWLLPDEFKSTERARAKMFPKPPFSDGGILT